MASTGMYVKKSEIKNTATSLTEKKEQLIKLGNTLSGNLTEALKSEKGDVIETLNKKIGDNATQDTLLYLVQKQVPDLIEGLISLLNENLKAIEETDAQLASSIK